MQKRLKKLQRLTQMALDVEMMKLRQIAQSAQEMADQIKALDVHEHQRILHLNDNAGTDMALYAGADRRWARWVRQQKIEINTQRAQLLAKREEQRSATMKTFGKDQAVRKLAVKAKDAAMLKQRRI